MMRRIESLKIALLFGASILGLGAVVSAQQAPPASQQPEEIPAQQYPQYPPQGAAPGAPQQGYPQQPGQGDLGAARISFIRGDVTTQHNNSSDWSAATVNTPVVSGDRVSTGNNSRAEIQLDHANTLRMSDQASVNVVNLSPSQMQIQVAQGLVNFDVTKGSDAAVEIQTPNVAIHPETNEGSYRIQVNSDGETIVDVRKGSAEISTPQGSTRVERDQRITIEGNADSAQYQVSGAPGRDEWDKWNSDRDHEIESAASWQHTNPYYTGSQDLDAYGQWNNVPDYGDVWFPQAGSDWVPYRDGRWVFEPYYGWTWVSYEPWGWAPYHYGRWFVYGGRWGWWPGPVYGGYRPLWAPAYVSFFGFGGGGWGVSLGFGFGGGFGNVGWLPVGPGDRFYPWYGRGVSRVNVVNVYNVRNDRGGFAPLREGRNAFSNVDRAFTDEHVRNGISSMRGDQFGRGAVPRQQQRFDAGSFRQASFMTGANPVAPSRDSFRASDRQVNTASIPNRGAANQQFFSGNTRSMGQFGQGSNRGANSGVAQPQQNAARPGFRSFGSSNSANVSRGSEQTARPYQGSAQGRGGFGSPSSQQQPYSGGRTFEGQGVPQNRSGYSQPNGQSSRQYQPYSRGSYGNGGYSRPQLNMQQPVVTPRGYSAPPQQNAPGAGGRGAGGYRGAPSGGYGGGGYRGGASSAGPSNGGYRGAPSGSGSSRGGYSGGGSRGGSSSSGGRSSSEHGRH